MELCCKVEEDFLFFYEGERVGGVDILDDIFVVVFLRMSISVSLFMWYIGS